MAYFLDDEHSEYAEAIFDYTVKDNAQIISPSIFYLEALNVLQISLKRNRLTKQQFLQLNQAVAELEVDIDLESTLAKNVPAISALMQQHQLTAYDAAYLELSIRRNVPLATLDKALRKAAKAHNLLAIHPTTH